MRLYSIVIPAHNEASEIIGCLESICAQTYPSSQIEAVVVNNASTDDTRKIAMDFAEGNRNYNIVIIDEPELGASKAKNKGGTHSQGEVLVFLDADSRMKEDLVEKIDGHYQAGFKAGMIRTISRDPHLIANLFWEFVEFGKRNFPRPAGQSYCKKSIFSQVEGFNPRLKLAEDVDFLMRVEIVAGKLGHVQDSCIYTSNRRMEKEGYLNVLLHWGFGYWGLLRGNYGVIRK